MTGCDTSIHLVTRGITPYELSKPLLALVLAIITLDDQRIALESKATVVEVIDRSRE